MDIEEGGKGKPGIMGWPIAAPDTVTPSWWEKRARGGRNSLLLLNVWSYVCFATSCSFTAC